MDMAAGSVVDPAVLQVNGVIRLRGTAPVTLLDLELNGEINSDRPITVDDMDVTAGALHGDFALTVQPGGSFTKSGFGTLSIRNTSGNAAADSADLVLNADASLVDGTICVSWSGDPDLGDPDRPGLYINQDFTIGSGAPSGAFQCGPQFGNSIHVNGPDGHLSKVGTGTTNFNDLDVAGGTLSVASGQTFAFPNTYKQSGGLTEIAPGGVLQALPVLTGGVLRGGGQLTGNLTNTSGTVRPGTSPGTLTVTGSYTQGADGVLGIDVDGSAQGTQFDHLAVGGAASLDGTVAIVKGSAFDPAVSDSFQFLTSASRTGTFDALTGSLLPSGKGYALDYPAGSDFGSPADGHRDAGIGRRADTDRHRPRLVRRRQRARGQGHRPGRLDRRPLRDIGLQRIAGGGRQRSSVRLPRPHRRRRRQLDDDLPRHRQRRLGHLALLVVGDRVHRGLGAGRRHRRCLDHAELPRLDHATARQPDHGRGRHPARL